MAIEELNNYKKVRYSKMDIINNVTEKRELVGFIFRIIIGMHFIIVTIILIDFSTYSFSYYFIGKSSNYIKEGKYSNQKSKSWQQKVNDG